MKNSLVDYWYELPAKFIAQTPLADRDASRLLVLERAAGRIHHDSFSRLPTWLNNHDILVVNDTRVFPARLRGRKDSGGQIELLLLQPPASHNGNTAAREAGGTARYRSSRKPKVGQQIFFNADLQAEIMAINQPGEVEVRFWSPTRDIWAALQDAGELPLPPYIRRPVQEDDQFRYQTLFAAHTGAVAAPTAGLHFSAGLIKKLQALGVELVTLTLHVGPGTFQPVRTADYRQHRVAPEFYRLTAEAADRLNEARGRGKNIVAVGTTSVRVLEFQGQSGRLHPGEGWCDLYIYPGYTFRVVNKMITNFHLPQSSLLLLVSAFAGREKILAAYEEALAREYRFYSYGDAMLIV